MNTIDFLKSTKISLKAVFFDLDGTVIVPEPSPIDAFLLLAHSIGIQIDSFTERKVRLWTHRYWGNDNRANTDRANLSKDDFWLNYSKLLLQKVNAKKDLEINALKVRNWFYNQYKPNVNLAPEILDLLTFLKNKNYRLGIITNRAESIQGVLSEFGLESFFDSVVVAGEIGYWKPNPIIFSFTLKKYKGLKASECIYVGDNCYADCYGAIKVGMLPILIDPNGFYPATCPFNKITRFSDLQKLILSHEESIPY